jgi:hypothetical protein
MGHWKFQVICLDLLLHCRRCTTNPLFLIIVYEMNGAESEVLNHDIYVKPVSEAGFTVYILLQGKKESWSPGPILSGML